MLGWDCYPNFSTPALPEDETPIQRLTHHHHKRFGRGNSRTSTRSTVLSLEARLAPDNLLGELLDENPGPELNAPLRRAANEAAALVWFTPFPLLLFPVLLKEKAAALWKMDDFDDALYTFGIGLAASITSATQLKVELLDSFKNKPPSAGVEKNDVAVLVSFVYKVD